MSRPVPGPRIHQVRRGIDACSPAALLSAGQGGPRGFWASGDRWIAHAGLVEEIVVPVGRQSCRFVEVRDRAGALFGGVEGDGPQRLFGGFAFAPPKRGDRAWASFPPALFHLPEAELEHNPLTGECALLVRGRDPEETRRAWTRWARAVSAWDPHGRPGRGRAGAPASGAGVAASGPSAAASGPSAAAHNLERAIWHRMVSGTLRRIGDGEAEKVVLARTMDVAPSVPVEPLDLVMELWEENHGSYVFLFEPEAGSVLVGATPETIATLVNGVVRSTAVAGSIAVGGDSVETAQFARELYNSDKERAEHACVVRDMVARLSALGCTVRRDVAPHVLTLARIQHLETKIAATVPDGLNLLDILASLHPTPAVCGTPRNVALSILTENELFDRGWYAGPVGWFASDGKGIFVPALRSAVGTGSRWRLFAGGGIVAGSNPALEWEESELKFQPVLRAMARAGVTAGAAAGSG